MPKPKRGETEKEFIKRCIPELIREGKYATREQSIAVCYSIYRKRGTEPASPKPNNPNKKLRKSDKAKIYCAICH